MSATSHHALDRWQYRITSEPAQDAYQVADLWLTGGPDLPVTQVFDQGGTPIGLLVGFAIEIAQAQVIRETWTAPVNAADPIDKTAKTLLWALGGRFIWICNIDDSLRIYPDAGGQVTCVFDADLKCAGATAASILDDSAYSERFNQALFDQLGVNGEGWFPAGLTAHHGITRLLPNHFLDLKSWRVSRFAAGASTQPDMSPQAITDRLIAITRAQMKALIRHDKSPAVALTAGYETRALLACARPYLDDVKFVTVVGEDRHQIDTTIATQIADDLGLTHIKLHRQVATPSQQQLFLRRCGHCHGDSNVKFHPSVWPLGPDHDFVGGLGGEIGRAFLWRATDRQDTAITTDVLMTRFGLRQSQTARDAIEAWLTALKTEIGDDAFAILDLAYVENRMGPWANVQFCADPSVVRYAPMFTYETSELMRSLPADWKREGKLGVAMITQLWPELNKYPYNSLGPLKDIWVKIQRMIANPAMISKKLRQLGR